MFSYPTLSVEFLAWNILLFFGITHCRGFYMYNLNAVLLLPLPFHHCKYYASLDL